MKYASEKTTSKNQSAAKALKIIELLSLNREPVRLQDLSEQLEINVSTVSRFLTTLEACGYVAQDPETLRYYLTFKICGIANRVSENVDLFGIAQPIMREVSALFQESACLAIEEDMAVVYIGVIPGPDQMLRTMQRIGNRAPMHCTGVGKVLLTDCDEHFIDRMILEQGLAGFTAHTITTRPLLLAAVKRAREDGYAFDDEECEIGAKCVAVPVRDYTGRVVAGLSVTGPIFRMTGKRIEKCLPILMEKAHALSRLLGAQE